MKRKHIDTSSTSSSSSSSSSDSDESNDSHHGGEKSRRSIITGKKIKMHREVTMEDKLLDIERAAKRHYMNSQYQ